MHARRSGCSTLATPRIRSFSRVVWEMGTCPLHVSPWPSSAAPHLQADVSRFQPRHTFQAADDKKLNCTIDSSARVQFGPRDRLAAENVRIGGCLDDESNERDV